MNKEKPRLIAFRVSEEEYEQIESRVAESGMKKQDFFWRCIMNQPIVKREYNPLKLNKLIAELERLTAYVKKIQAELNKQGSNLNQIAKIMNETGRNDADLNEINAMIEKECKECDEVWQSLKQFRAELLSDE